MFISNVAMPGSTRAGASAVFIMGKAQLATSRPHSSGAMRRMSSSRRLTSASRPDLRVRSLKGNSHVQDADECHSSANR